MAYTIYNNDGTVLSTIAIGEVDSYSTSLDLIGKNVNNYGEYYNNNLVKLLTSFASPDTEQPISPQVGQMWFDKTATRLKVYDGTSFRPTYGSHVSGTQPATTSTGDFWYDTVNSQLRVWNGTIYNLIGPATSSLLGKIGILPPTLPIRDDYTKVVQKVTLINSYGSYVGIITTSSFTMEASSSTIYLAGTSRQGLSTNIVSGVTLLNSLDVKGSIFIDGWNVKNHPNLDLTAYYPITPYGTYTATTTLSTFTTTGVTNKLAYDNANRDIAATLAKVFSTSTYLQSSEVSVICSYNSEMSVRKFKLQNLYGANWWEPLSSYSYSWTSTTTAIVGPSVCWLWTSTTTATNIVL
jgi:hypothetical protein